MLIAFQLQQSLHERASIIHYTNNAPPVFTSKTWLCSVLEGHLNRRETLFCCVCLFQSLACSGSVTGTGLSWG